METEDISWSQNAPLLQSALYHEGFLSFQNVGFNYLFHVKHNLTSSTMQFCDINRLKGIWSG